MGGDGRQGKMLPLSERRSTASQHARSATASCTAFILPVLVSVTKGNQRQNPLKSSVLSPPLHAASQHCLRRTIHPNTPVLTGCKHWERGSADRKCIHLLAATIPLALFYTYGKGGMEKYNALKLGASPGTGIQVLLVPGLSSND